MAELVLLLEEHHLALNNSIEGLALRQEDQIDDFMKRMEHLIERDDGARKRVSRNKSVHSNASVFLHFSQAQRRHQRPAMCITLPYGPVS